MVSPPLNPSSSPFPHYGQWSPPAKPPFLSFLGTRSYVEGREEEEGQRKREREREKERRRKRESVCLSDHWSKEGRGGGICPPSSSSPRQNVACFPLSLSLLTRQKPVYYGGRGRNHWSRRGGEGRSFPWEGGGEERRVDHWSLGRGAANSAARLLWVKRDQKEVCSKQVLA